MAIYLLRHGHAGHRSGWSGDDYQRPLSERGAAQARYLADLFTAVEIQRVLSSPAQRCIETAQPWADRLGRPVEVLTGLGEGSDPRAALDLLLAHGEDDIVAVSHGDVIPAVIRRLNASGMRGSNPTACQKGSAWVLEVDAGRVVHGDYHAPG